jgi:cyclic 2,3-diphosphoglycerate synthase
MRALAIADGEHYAPVVRDALVALPYEFVAVWLAGGTEKLRGGEDYGVPVVDELDAAIAELEPEVVVDLSDEPVLGPRERFRVASRVLAHGLPYVGADFRFDPPELAPFPRPSLSVVGTGKRVGKTAVTGHLARLLARDREVVVVAMGRGGPPEPEVAEVKPTLERLLELSRAGRHAASDYLETAALAGVVTIGCRRAGGGLAGAPGDSNVLAGAALAAEREPDLVVFDGSGASIPPVDTGARVLVTSAAQPAGVVAGYLNAFRILVSDLVVLTGAEEGSGHEQLEHAIHEVKELPVVPVVLRPRPAEPVLDRRVAYFSTAPAEVH